jgi:hypothetical protein
LYRAGFASQPQASHRADSLTLHDCFISAVGRCAPPNNKPTRDEIANCLPYLKQEMNLLSNLQGIVTLGSVAFNETLTLLGVKSTSYTFGHGLFYEPGSGLPWLLASYHPSRQNTQTGRLTTDMFDSIWKTVQENSNEPKEKDHQTPVNPIRAAAVYIFGLLIIFAGVYLFTLSPVGPLPEALPYLQSTDRVQVTAGNYAWFQPVEKPAQIGFIFYPGGRVDYRSYAPLAARLAEKGWPSAIIPMPLNLAVFGTDKAAEVIKGHPEVTRWVIAGHSLGGTMASQFAGRNPDSISGIVFLASYPVMRNWLLPAFPLWQYSAKMTVWSPQKTARNSARVFRRQRNGW